MEAFSYPVRPFACRTYPEELRRTMDSNDEVFFRPLCAFAGAVAGETGVEGLRLDFRCGLRLEVPEGDYHVRLTDGETGVVLFEDDVSGALLVSDEKYLIPWHVEVARGGETVFVHDCDVTGQSVYIALLSANLGDMLAALPNIEEFAAVHDARVTLRVVETYESLVRLLYPALPLAQAVPEDAYAAYYLGNGNGDPHQSPVDGRIIPLELISRVSLGLEGAAPPPSAAIGARLRALPRPMEEPYVCIAVQGSSVLKSWLWPGGWDEVVSVLRAAGYRVLCIDREREQSGCGITVRIPEGAEDFTGARPLEARAQFLAHAAFFVGLGSGLAWLARMAGCPVVMIAGFSLPWYEFPEAERVWNPRVCHGCFQQTQQGKSFLTAHCPRYGKDSPHFLECQRQIAPRRVLAGIERLAARIGGF